LSFSTKLQKKVAETLAGLAPGIPFADAEIVRQEAASRRYREFPPSVSVWLVLTAHIRHQHTEYEALIREGYDHASARHFVIDAINAKLTEWRATRFIVDDD
jgi:hypothetical protein